MDNMKKLALFMLLIALAAAWTVSGADTDFPSSGGSAAIKAAFPEKGDSGGGGDEDGDRDEGKDKDDDDDDGGRDKDEDDDEDEDDDDGKGGRRQTSASRYSALNYHGTLSSYVPRREAASGLNWGRIVFEQESNDEKDGKPEYEASYEGGKLQELEIEIELKDGTEYEVVFDGERKIIRAEYETGGKEIYFDGSSWHDSDGHGADGPDLDFMREYFDSYQLQGTWYRNNTVSLIGLSLREMYPQLTDKWYQVVPIDLTQEGVFRYPLAASNMYCMGSCIVTVRDGTVTTDYTLPLGNVFPESDCLMWFTDIKDITPEFLEAPVGAYQFGRPVSVRDDLKGRKIALLFICNHVTYQVPLTGGGTMPASYYRENMTVIRKLREFESLFAQMQ